MRFSLTPHFSEVQVETPRLRNCFNSFRAVSKPLRRFRVETSVHYTQLKLGVNERNYHRISDQSRCQGALLRVVSSFKPGFKQFPNRPVMALQ